MEPTPKLSEETQNTQDQPKKNYILRLKEENAQLKQAASQAGESGADVLGMQARIQQLEEQLYQTDTAPNYNPEDRDDDRNHEVEIVYGPTLREFQIKVLKKKDAVEFLYNYYVHRKPTGRNVPKFGRSLDEPDVPVNASPCYVKIARRDHYKRSVQEYYKDMPLWILVDRMINHPQEYMKMQLVRKEEWMEDQRQAAELERNWDKERRDQEQMAAAYQFVKKIQQ